MFHKSLEEFISHQKGRLSDEKLKFSLIDSQKTEKNESEVFVSNKGEINTSEKENIPCNINCETSQQNACIDRMLRYGEFSPNNPKMRVATQPYIGLGEYEQRKHLLLQQRKAEYQQYAEKSKRSVEAERNFLKNSLQGSRPVSCSRDKAVQTDIQNINCRLIQYDPNPRPSIEKEKSPRGHGVKIDKVQIETQNNIIIPGQPKFGDKSAAYPNSPRAKLMADLQSSYFPTLMGYTAKHTEDEDRLEKVRRQEKYLAELKQQIEEKQILVAKHKEQEKYEQEKEAGRLESDLRNINREEKQILSGRHSYHTDFQEMSRDYENKTGHRNNKWSDNKYRPRMLDSSLTHYSDPVETKSLSQQSFVNSPPLSKRDKRPPYSFNISPNSIFANPSFVKENIEKRDSKLTNSTTKYTTKGTQKKSYFNASQLEEPLPIPVLKAQSPVAKELKNAVAVQSKSSDAMRKLEDKWQIPVVQQNIIKTAERPMEGNNNHSILTQLGAIRLQLQQEQLRLDETLRKRGSSQTVAQADVHHNVI